MHGRRSTDDHVVLSSRRVLDRSSNLHQDQSMRHQLSTMNPRRDETEEHKRLNITAEKGVIQRKSVSQKKYAAPKRPRNETLPMPRQYVEESSEDESAENELLCLEEELPPWHAGPKSNFAEHVINDWREREKREREWAEKWKKFCPPQGEASVDSACSPEDTTRTRELHEMNDPMEGPLRYSWQSLGLGDVTGTPAYNAYLRKKCEELGAPVPAHLTSEDLFKIVNSLKAGTVGLQSDSRLGLEREQVGNSNKHRAGNDVEFQQTLLESFEEVRQEIRRQDNPTWEETYQRKTDHMTTDQVQEKLRSFETEVGQLEDREIQVLKKAKDAGIVPHEVVDDSHRMLGTFPP